MSRKFVFIIFMLSSIVFCTENYKLVRLENIDENTIPTIAALGIDLEGINYRQEVFFEFSVSESELEVLVSAGFEPMIIHDDLAEFYASRLTGNYTREFGFGSMGGYYTFDEVIEHLDELHNDYPELVSDKIEIGVTFEDRPIYAIRLSDNPEVDEDEPEILYTALHHAREPESMMVLFYYMYHLVENYGSDPEVTALLNHRQMWFVPVVNPDGYEYNRENDPNGGGMHRKNRRPGCPVSYWAGVDPNRNYGFNWGYDNQGSSGDWCENTYRGTAPFSEAENVTISDFIEEHDFKIVLNYHSYGNYLIIPSGSVPGELPPDDDLFIFEEFAADMTQFNGYVSGTDMQTVGYSVNGDSDSWAYNVNGIFAFTPEVGSSNDGFWPSTDRIVPLAEENLYPNLFTSMSAGAKYQSNIYFDSETFLPGNTYLLGLEVLNQGLSNSPSDVTVNITTTGSIEFTWDELTLDPVAARGSADLGLFVEFTVSEDAVTGSQIQFDVTVSDDQEFNFTDTAMIICGVPTLIFADDAESGMSNWTTNGWGTSNNSFAGNYAFTDSPGGEYNSESNNFLRSNEPIDLANTSYASLNYHVTWDIEDGWDFAQVFASTDGSSWSPLEGEFMSAGSGQGMQETDEYGYDGESDWVWETVNINDYLGESQVWLKFQLSSDTYVEGDGIYIDDLQLWAFEFISLPGDVDQNGVLNVLDLVRIVAIILNSPPEPTPDELQISDVNQDGTINVLDVVVIVNLIVDVN